MRTAIFLPTLRDCRLRNDHNHCTSNQPVTALYGLHLPLDWFQTHSKTGPCKSDRYMNIHLYSQEWLALVEHAIQNAPNTRGALDEALRAIGEQMDFIISMDLDYIRIKSHRELAEILTNEATDEFCHAMWSIVESIMDLHDRSESLDDASFEKEVEAAVQLFDQNPSAYSSPNENLWGRLLTGAVAFVQGWSKGYAEADRSRTP